MSMKRRIHCAAARRPQNLGAIGTAFIGRSSLISFRQPDLVCEIAFSGWTSDGLLRHPSFKGLREDKPAGRVKREVAAATPNSRADHVSSRKT